MGKLAHTSDVGSIIKTRADRCEDLLRTNDIVNKFVAAGGDRPRVLALHRRLKDEKPPEVLKQEAQQASPDLEIRWMVLPTSVQRPSGCAMAR